MPYIDRESRLRLDCCGFNDCSDPTDAGELTYKLYKTCARFIGPKPRFIRICTVMGALLCTALEIYRRIAAPYEDTKIKENGDVKL